MVSETGIDARTRASFVLPTGGEKHEWVDLALVLPFGLWLMKHTMLGNPLIKPWEDLARLAGRIEMEQFMFGSWYICRAIKG